MYAKVSTPTNIGKSNPPYQLATRPCGSFLNKPHTLNPTSSRHMLYTILTQPSFPPLASQCTTLQLSNPGSAARFTQLRLILHLYARPVWQYTLNATQPCTNQRTVRSRHFPTCTRAHRLLKRTNRYLVTHKMTHSSTYTTPE